MTIVVDAQGMQTEEEFLRELCRKIEEACDAKSSVFNHLRQRWKQLVQGGWEGNPLRAIGRLDPRQFSEALIAALNAQQRKTVILVDEIALLVAKLREPDAAGARAFLHRLRRLREGYPHVQWLLTGSVGLDVVARSAGLQGALVDLDIFPLEPFADKAARSFLDDLCAAGLVRRPFALDDAAFAYLAQELGWLAPFYLRLVADRISPTGSPVAGRPSVQNNDIDRAFAELLRPEYRTLFATFEEHIDKNFPEAETRRLRAILDACCEFANGETEPTLLARLEMQAQVVTVPELRNLLTALATAGYLTPDGDRWRFRSGLLRRYWLKYHHA